jgi:hypothetical protein
MGYFRLEGKDMDQYYVLGTVLQYVPAEDDRFTVIQDGDMNVTLDPRDQIQQHDFVKIVRRDGMFVFVKDAPTGPSDLVTPGSKAEAGFSDIVNAVVEITEAAVARNLQGRNLKQDVIGTIRAAMKAKQRLGGRSSALSTAQRQARNGSMLLIKAIESLKDNRYARVMSVNKDGKAIIRKK